MALALAACFAAQAQPTGAQAVVGSATLTQTGSRLVVSTLNGAGTSHSVINWQSFGVPAGSSTWFAQPGSSSTSINRVMGADPSAIYGTLGSNGRLVLVNPAGISVGAGAVVDSAGFTASTLRMGDADALGGRLRFQAGGSAGGVSVHGSVLARRGDVVLIGPSLQVGAGGVIESRGGATILAAGRAVEITGRGLEGIHLGVQAPGDQAVNLGTLKGDAVGIFAGTLRHSGTIQAQTATLEGGRIVLRAQEELEIAAGAKVLAEGAAGQAGGSISIISAEGSVHVAGTLSAASPAQSTTDSSGKGGRVEVLGQQVHLDAGAAIDASGDAGGGVILVGGDLQGRNPEVMSAQDTSVAAGVVLAADARVLGDGGKLIVWADKATHFNGHLSARGGEQGGDGGSGETSGKHLLHFRGTADLSARRGRQGNLLLDPVNILVGTFTDANGDGTQGDDVTGDIASTDFPGATSRISAVGLTALLNTTDVTLAATNSITIDSPVAKTGSVPTVLVLTAPGVNINSSIGTSGGALTLDITGSTASVAAAAAFDGLTLGRSLTLLGNGLLNIRGGLQLVNGTTLDTGTIRVFTDGTLTIGPVPGAAATIQAGGGSLYINSTGTASETLTLGAGLTFRNMGAGTDVGSSGGTLINNGEISGGGTGRLLRIEGVHVVNNGVVKTSGGDIDLLLSGSFSNSPGATLANDGGLLTIRATQALENKGSILLTAGATSLGGFFTPAALSAGYTRTGGALYLDGTLDLQGTTLDIGSAGLFGTGGLSTLNGTIKNGTLVSGDAATLRGGMAATLEAMTIGDANRPNLTAAPGGWLAVNRGLTLVEGARFDLGNTTLYLSAGQTVGPRSGTARLIVANNTAYIFSTVEFGAGLTYQGSGSIEGYPIAGDVANLVNYGTIQADVPGQTLTVSGTHLSNYGTVKAAGGKLVLSPFTMANVSGATLANEGGMLVITDVSKLTNTGNILLTAGTTDFGGLVPPAALDRGYTRTGGDVWLSGTMDLQGGTLDLGAAGMFGPGGLTKFYGGTVANGTLISSDSTALTANSAVLSGMTVGNALHPYLGISPDGVGSSRVDLQACKLEYSIVSPK